MPFFRTVDELIRGERTSREQLATGKIDLPLGSLLAIVLVLGAVYGAFMGLYSVARPLRPGEERAYAQLLATTVKVPLLFLLTLGVTFPSLYVFSTLAGSPLAFLQALRLLLAGIAIHLTLLASFGPITAFFTFSTDSYPFMKLLNVVFFAMGGIAGTAFVHRALTTVIDAKLAPPPLPPAPEGGPTDSARSLLGPPPMPAAQRRARQILAAWIVIYGAVGAQMGWIMRPFVGSPEQPFTWFRHRESNFFRAIRDALEQLFR